jgi:hypothetical protein
MLLQMKNPAQALLDRVLFLEEDADSGQQNISGAAVYGRICLGPVGSLPVFPAHIYKLFRVDLLLYELLPFSRTLC